MNLSSNGKKFIYSLEGGFRGKAYLLNGIPHIGYGFTYYQSTTLRNKFGRTSVKMGDSISQAEADAEFEIIVKPFVDDVNEGVKVSLSQSQFDSLVSFHYNTGNLLGSTLLKRVNERNWSAVYTEFEKWVYVTINGKKVVSNGLKKRRGFEIALFKTGKYSASNTNIDVNKTKNLNQLTFALLAVVAGVAISKRL